jgi:hypothetical protein
MSSSFGLAGVVSATGTEGLGAGTALFEAVRQA